ncbi:response regulator [Desulforhopalus singaporensis]|uniref:Response regulator containing CheY-like receiver, AAA-type ATPase, and DNA-binding domains n=1 Tax=Desulforhopalus singaporensis TaxID=91360 RepID=A0A1H0SXP7_9BACT|nr:response regulator [Desulforhopalus singaporensis]SDP46330.1 Response regulator containing CheY-like receiver, AAA-type ATPase, and DNA-binding domains [Desulforhopalus singaporensis]
MSSIAIFPCTFTPADRVAKKLSESLELNLYQDVDLIAETAAQHDIDPEKLKNCIYGKTSVFNQFTLEKEKTVAVLKSVLAKRLVEASPTLYYGFLTTLIPARVTHILKTLIVDTRQGRIEQAMATFQYSEKEARKTLKKSDLTACYWSDFLMSKEPYDSSLYDLVIPVENRSESLLAQSIEKRFHTTSILVTAHSMQAVKDMVLETKVCAQLLASGHNLKVSAENHDVTITVEKSVLNFTRLADELTEIAKNTDGVKNVEVVKSSRFSESIYRKQHFELPSKVLFVDDEKEFVQTVSQRLISRDVGTYGVFNGEDALDLITDDDRPDVMVLDLKMPGMHGVDVLRETKKLAPEIEVIILTGHGTNEDMRQCMELGAFAYLNKPVDIEKLSATIKAANKKAHEK